MKLSYLKPDITSLDTQLAAKVPAADEPRVLLDAFGDYIYVWDVWDDEVQPLTESLEELLKLCPELLLEASTGISLFEKGNLFAKKLITYLHKEQNLPHNQEFREVWLSNLRKKGEAAPEPAPEKQEPQKEKLVWADVKGAYDKRTKDFVGHAWMLIKGSRGVAALHQTAYDSYFNIFFCSDVKPPHDAESVENGEGIYAYATQSLTSAKGFIKKTIGETSAYYVANDADDRNDTLKGKRNELKSTPGGEKLLARMMTKLRPIFVKVLTAAKMDVKGWIGTMIKNDSFDRATKKVKHVANLDKIISHLEHNPKEALTTFQFPYDQLFKHLKIATLMAMHHYYPDKMGVEDDDFDEALASRYDIDLMLDSEGANQFEKDLQAGDMKKLSAILSYFKRGLVRG
jgi:hypothetical protein